MRVLSGIQPSGQLHFGNYLGYVQPNIEWGKKAEVSYIMIVDLHALTTVHDPSVLQANTDGMLLDLLACGFDSTKTVIFRQSYVPEHAELMWILSTVTPMGLLERAVSFKEKLERGIAASMGLFAYPVLQTADILLYDITTVPVGKDQKQHIEIARDIAGKFNNTYGETLVLPEPVIREDVAVVPGIDGQKMSKSYGNTIPVFGDEKVIKKAIMGIVTDSRGVNDPKDPDTCVIYNIHKHLLPPSDAKALADRYREGLPYGEGKKLLLQTYLDHFALLRERRQELEGKPEHVQEVLREGTQKASAVAQKTMDRVRKATGLR